MSEPAIVVEQLGKRYKIGRAVRTSSTWRGALANMLAGHLNRLRLLSERGREDEFIWALREANFTVRRGEIVGVIGRNGSGKSTLLKILSRVVTPTTGRATIHGRVGSLLEVGTGFHPELTGRENIYLNGAILGMRRTEIRRVFDEIVAFSEIGRFLDTPVKRYSSGMYVRLAFAVAAHLRAEIMIVDEVLAVGDAQFQQKCLGKMSDVAQGGRTVLFVSHNMRAVAGLCERALLLAGGGIVDDGPAERVISRYLADLHGESQANSAELEYPEDPARPAQVTRVCLKDAAGRPTCRHELLHPLTVEIEFVLREDLENLIVGLQVRSTLDEVILQTTDVDGHNYETGENRSVFPRRAGRYAARVSIPAPLLNADHYALVVNLNCPRVARLDTVHGPRFEINDINTFASCIYQRTRRGVLAVPVPWEVEHVSDRRIADAADRQDQSIPALARE